MAPSFRGVLQRLPDTMACFPLWWRGANLYAWRSANSVVSYFPICGINFHLLCGGNKHDRRSVVVLMPIARVVALVSNGCGMELPLDLVLDLVPL